MTDAREFHDGTTRSSSRRATTARAAGVKDEALLDQLPRYNPFLGRA